MQQGKERRTGGIQGKLGKLLYCKGSWGERKFIENEYKDMDGTSGNELVQNLNRLCRCYGARNCEDVCVYGAVSSERRCVIDRQEGFSRFSSERKKK